MKKLGLFFINRMKENKVILISLIIYSLFCIFTCIYFSVGEKKILINLVFGIVFFITGFVPFVAEFVVNLKESSFFYISYLLFCLLSLVGPAFDLYTVFPSLDTIIHMYSGLLFAAIGYSIGAKYIDITNHEKKTFSGRILFSAFFCLSCGVLWEIMEYIGTIMFKVDNQEDTLLTHFVSYGLSGTRDYVTELSNIQQTIIYYLDDNGVLKEHIIKGGYYDLGLVDTILDLVACLAGSVLFSLITIVSFFSKKRFIKYYIPITPIKEKTTEIKQNNIDN